MPETNPYSIKKIVVFCIIILVIAGLIGFFIVRMKSKTPADEPDDKNLFPFGTTSPTVPGTVIPGTDTEPPVVVVQNPLTTSGSDRLRQIANYPVTAFFPSIVNKVVSTPKFDDKTRKTIFISSTVPTNSLRWNVKQTGVLMDAEVTSDSITLKQATQTQVPNAEELWPENQGRTWIYRFWDAPKRTINSYVGSFPASSELQYCTITFTQELKRGSKGAEVKELQKFINVALNTGLVEDGSFGKKLLAAIKGLQKYLEVEETAVYDQATRDAINEKCMKVQADFAEQAKKPAKLTGTLLESGIIRGTVSPDGTQVFFLKASGSGVVGVVAKSDTTGQRIVFRSPFTEWMPQWVNATTIAMTTLATRETGGYLYFLNPVSGNFQKILGPIRGLTTLTDPSAKTVLYSQSTDIGFTTQTYSIGTGEIKTLDLSTLPAKCVWQDASVVMCGVPQSILRGQYPDEWYQGTVSFGDTLWSVDTVQGSTDSLLVPSQKFDMVHLGLSPDKNYVYFINKMDGTLWSFRME